jgi:60 kDa SS-A/Ro ribonucleoprotein
VDRAPRRDRRSAADRRGLRRRAERHSETWAGSVHPGQALREYRERAGIAARLVAVDMIANAFTIADPDDPGMLDIVGFDTATPAVLTGFAAGAL